MTKNKPKTAEKGSDESAWEWRSAIENASDIIMIVDLDGIIRSINRTVPGLTVEHVIGTTVYVYTPREFHDSLRQCIE